MTTAIRIESVSKLYRLGTVGTGTIAHDLNRWWHQIRGKEDPYAKIGQVNDRTKRATRNEKRAAIPLRFPRLSPLATRSFPLPRHFPPITFVAVHFVFGYLQGQWLANSN